MIVHEFDKGIVLDDILADSVYLVVSGQVELRRKRMENINVETRSFFGEEHVLFGRRSDRRYRTLKACSLYQIPGSAIKKVPIVMWKMLETFEYRAAPKQQ